MYPGKGRSPHVWRRAKLSVIFGRQASQSRACRLEDWSSGLQLARAYLMVDDAAELENVSI
jgi:hypothetical protein